MRALLSAVLFAVLASTLVIAGMATNAIFSAFHIFNASQYVAKIWAAKDHLTGSDLIEVPEATQKMRSGENGGCSSQGATYERTNFR